METYVESLTESLTQPHFSEQWFLEDVDYDNTALEEMFHNAHRVHVYHSQREGLSVGQSLSSVSERTVRPVVERTGRPVRPSGQELNVANAQIRARGARLLFQNHTGKSGRRVSWTKSRLSKRTMKSYEYIHVRLFMATRRIYHNYPSAQARPNQIRFVMRTALAFRGLLEVYAFTFCKDNTSNDPCAIIGYR